jgi:pyruvate dehydrogenase E2 component (dihydrolipoyllysine-residue acetyltransferase)
VHTSPHVLTVVEVDYENVDRVRKVHKEEWRQSEGFSLTYLPFVARAVIDAFAEFPDVNAQVEDDHLLVFREVNLGIAVDLDFQGLIVPVLKGADTMRLRGIARDVNELADRARNRKLGVDDITGGTFTITNNGSYGTYITAAIINQPQVAILSTDGIARRPVVIDDGFGNETIAVHSVGHLSLSWDHRAFDGGYAASFLRKAKEHLETRDWAAEL